MRFRMAVMAAALMTGPALAESTSPLVIHEWGTFTSLQNEQGKAIGGINSDDEPVPGFVHRISSGIVDDDLSKGVVRSIPSVTMRLETPVLYFHPPKDAKLPMMVNVQAEFRGGWLTEFYPNATASTEHFTPPAPFKMGSLTAKSVGKLDWLGLTVGTDKPGPITNAKVWTAPRAVDAAPVATAKGEAERYLFYRGVGNLDAPLKAVRDGENFKIQSQLDGKRFSKELKVPHAWLADIRADGTCAVRILPPLTLTPGAGDTLTTIPATFDSSAYTGIDELKVEMRGALIESGLFEDEADAMLNTWEASYFKSPGLRLFFMVPQDWTDHYLPLKVSAPGQTIAPIKRAMIGRLELVTPRQREALRILNDKTATYTNEQKGQAYRDLGRFHEALRSNAAATKGTASAQ